MDRATFNNSWLKRLCLALFWLISIPAVLWALVVIIVISYQALTGTLSEHIQWGELVATVIACLATPLILYSLYWLIAWIAFGPIKAHGN